MVRWLSMGLDEALKLTLENIHPLSSGQTIDVIHGVGRILSENLYAKVDSPSVDASRKDGYAIVSGDITHATSEKPVRLKLTGRVAAGWNEKKAVLSGTAVRVLTGAEIPPGAEAVVSEEFVETDGQEILVKIFSEPGRNILPKGTDVSFGACIAQKGSILTPGLIGMLVAAGHNKVRVFPNPRVAILSTGDEVVEPGIPLPEGKLYASNMATLNSWCGRYGMITEMATARDDHEIILSLLNRMHQDNDTIITSGGAWTGDRDMVIHILEKMGWKQVFHGIRIGPGKAVGFGLLRGKPVFILPGGPPSNLMSFLQITLPGLQKLGGHTCPGLPVSRVKLSCNLKGIYSDWTQFFFGDLEMQSDVPLFHPLMNDSRLGSMSEAKAIVTITEGLTLLSEGSIVSAQLLV